MAEGAGTRLMYRMRYIMITKLVKLKCNFDFKFKNPPRVLS